MTFEVFWNGLGARNPQLALEAPVILPPPQLKDLLERAYNQGALDEHDLETSSRSRILELFPQGPRTAA